MSGKTWSSIALRRSSFVLILLVCAWLASVSVVASEEEAPGKRTEQVLTDRIALLEKRVFELEMQLKLTRNSGSEKSTSWWFRSSKKASAPVAKKQDQDIQPVQAFSHLSRGRLAHILASGGRKWHNFMHLNAAVMTQGDVTQLCKVPGKRHGYFATASDSGNLQVFHPGTGEIVLETTLAIFGEGKNETCTDSTEYFDSFSRVTAMSSHQVKRNESKLLVGHENGDVYAYHFSEKLTKSTYLPDEQVEFKLKEAPRRILTYSQRPILQEEDTSDGATSDEMKHTAVKEKEQHDIDGRSVSYVESYKVGYKQFHVIANKAGDLFVVYDNGTLAYKEHLPDPIVGMRPGMQQTLALVTAGGIRMLDLRRLRKTQPIQCEDLPQDLRFFSATFDANHNSKGYLVTEAGDVVTINVNSNKSIVRCVMKTNRALGLPTNFGMNSMKMRTIKNYLFVSIPQGTAIFNATGPPRRPPREILFEDKWAMGEYVGLNLEKGAAGTTVEVHVGEQPLLETQKNFVAILLGKRVLGIYHSELPVKGPMPAMQTKMWSQPIFLMAMLVMGFWQFNRMKTGGGGGGGGPAFTEKDADIMRMAMRGAGGAGMGGMGGMGGMAGMGGMGGMGDIGDPGMGMGMGMGMGDMRDMRDPSMYSRSNVY